MNLTQYVSMLDRCKSLLTAGFTAATWQATHVYALNDLVKPTVSNGSYYRCIQAGTSGATQPIWLITFRAEQTDGSAKWRQEDPVFILDYEPADFSYPCVIVGDTDTAEEQIAMGNVMENSLSIPVRIIAYKAVRISKAWADIRKQAFDVLMQVQAVIRNYPDLNHFEGVLSATCGDAGIVRSDNVFYEIQLIWKVKILPN